MLVHHKQQTNPKQQRIGERGGSEWHDMIGGFPTLLSDALTLAEVVGILSHTAPCPSLLAVSGTASAAADGPVPMELDANHHIGQRVPTPPCCHLPARPQAPEPCLQPDHPPGGTLAPYQAGGAQPAGKSVHGQGTKATCLWQGKGGRGRGEGVWVGRGGSGAGDACLQRSCCMYRVGQG
jgi:hypothetical protein